MKTLFDVYNDFYSDGDVDKFNSCLNDIGNGLDSHIIVRNMSKDYRELLLVIAKYLEVYSVDVKFSNNSYKTHNIISLLNTGKNYMRVLVTLEDIENLTSAMCDSHKFPTVVEGSCNEFNGMFVTNLKLDSINMCELMWDAVTLYLYGFPVRKEWTNDIILGMKRIYTRAETLSQAIIYICMCDDWMNKALCEMSSFGITANQWCSMYDGVLYDICKQNESGFIFIKNPRDCDSIVCISKIYVGKFFIVSSRIFNIMYENMLFDKIRFTDRLVKVKVVSDGSNSVVDRVLNVPVYTDNEHNEVLVSDIASREFVYNDVFINDVGKGY